MADSKTTPRFIHHPDASFKFWMDEAGKIWIEALAGGPVARGYANCASRLLNLESELQARGLMDPVTRELVRERD